MAAGDTGFIPLLRVLLLALGAFYVATVAFAPATARRFFYGSPRWSSYAQFFLWVALAICLSSGASGALGFVAEGPRRLIALAFGLSAALVILHHVQLGLDTRTRGR